MELIKWVRTQWDRAGAALTIAGGLLALLLGWLGASGSAFPAEQIPYVVSGGLFGLFLLGLGGMLWLSADLRDEWRKLDDLENAVREAAQTAAATSKPEATNSSSATKGAATNGVGRSARRSSPAGRRSE